MTAPFRAFVVDQTADEFKMGIQQLEQRDLPPGDVLIQVAYATVNYKDALVCIPNGNVARTSPLAPGLELIGSLAVSLPSRRGYTVAASTGKPDAKDYLFQLHPISTVYGGPMLWPLEQAADLIKFWRDFILNAPEEIHGWFGFVTVPPAPPFPEQFHLQKMHAIVWCYSGALEQADEAFKPIRTNIPPAVDFAGPIPWPALQSMFDALYPKGLQWYWKTDFFTKLSDKAIGLHVKYGAQLPTMHFHPINGAVQRVGKSETAFSFREANFAEVIVGVDPDPAHNERMIQWARDYWMALHPYSAGGGYINMMMDEGADYVQAAYRDNYARLAQIKARYDPGNLFHVNQNIKPDR